MPGGPGHTGPNMPCRPMGPGVVPGGPMSGGPMDGMPDSMGCSGPMSMGGPMMGKYKIHIIILILLCVHFQSNTIMLNE